MMCPIRLVVRHSLAITLMLALTVTAWAFFDAAGTREASEAVRIRAPDAVLRTAHPPAPIRVWVANGI